MVQIETPFLSNNIMNPLCSETQACPNVANPSFLLSSFYRFRYWAIRYLTCPIPFVKNSIPIIGGKSIFECLFILGTYGVLLGVCTKLDQSGSGTLASIFAGLLVLLGLRNNVATVFFSISFERALFWHKVFAFLALGLSIIHGWLCLSSDASFDPINSGQSKNLSGIILLAAMFVTSGSYILKKVFFEYFYVLHCFLYALIVALSIAHGVILFAGAALLWLADLFLRYYLCGRKVDVVVENLLADVVKVKFPKTFEYRASQYCFIMIPELSVYQFHPFTISSAPHEVETSFHIRALGNWTKQLQTHVEQRCKTEKAESISLSAYVEGPFGLPSIDLENTNYSVVLLITGGIGVTPAQSIFKHLMHQHESGNRLMRKCIFVWSVKDLAMVTGWDIEEDVAASKILNIQSVLSKRGQADTEDTPLSPSKKKSNSSVLPLSFQPCLDLPNRSDDIISRDAAKKSESLNPRKVSFSFAEDLGTPDPFHCEFYLTSVRSAEEFKAANIDIDQQPYIRFNRPNLPKLFDRVAQLCKAEGIARVAVVTCGPEPMINEVADLCDYRQLGVAFDLHKEVFNF